MSNHIFQKCKTMFEIFIETFDTPKREKPVIIDSRYDMRLLSKWNSAVDQQFANEKVLNSVQWFLKSIGNAGTGFVQKRRL